MLPQIPITNPLLHAFRWATSKNLSDVWRGIAIPWIFHPLKLSLSLYNQGGGWDISFPNKKTYSWQFLVTFLGWWNVTLSKVNRDLQRSGIKKAHQLKSPGYHYPRFLSSPQRISPKKTSTLRYVTLLRLSFRSLGPPRSQTAKCFVRSQDLAGETKKTWRTTSCFEEGSQAR